MHLRRLCTLTFFASTLVVTMATTASADPSLSDRETARSLMDDGDAKRDKADFKAALKSYEAADAIMHVPTTGLEVARAQAQLGMLLEARETLGRVNRLPPKPGEPAPFTAARKTAEALTAELGARKIRGEIDALSVLGVDPIRHLVLPRVVALILVMPVLNLVGFLVGCFGAYLGIVGFYGASPESFVAQFLANTNWLDLWSSEVKAMIYGGIIAVIASYKGLSVKGGPEGVGRAVNECVVACIVGCASIGVLYSAIFLAVNPDIAVQR